jgi:SAM-dependent methyltransferase
MAAFFADAGYEVHLLDTSTVALDIAQRNFETDGLRGYAVAGDALNLPYVDQKFDVCVSIGLLEHFAEIEPVLIEQMRVLRKGGVLLAYVVPERPLSAQVLGAPLNMLLRLRRCFKGLPASRSTKAPLYRNRFRSRDYLEVLQRSGVGASGAFGMFPLPLISHSPTFPFSSNEPWIERRIVQAWSRILSLRDRKKDAWICAEGWGLAFLVWAVK